MSLRIRGQVDRQFWTGKKVFLTGHTGFKGCWLSIWLSMMGARVVGFSLAPSTNPSLFELAKIDSLLECSNIGNICDFELLQSAIVQADPDIVIHMAAQPLVRYSYFNPVETYATNVMGTVHLLESIRNCQGVKAVVIVTMKIKNGFGGIAKMRLWVDMIPIAVARVALNLLQQLIDNLFFLKKNTRIIKWRLHLLDRATSLVVGIGLKIV